MCVDGEVSKDFSGSGSDSGDAVGSFVVLEGLTVFSGSGSGSDVVVGSVVDEVVFKESYALSGSGSASVVFSFEPSGSGVVGFESSKSFSGSFVVEFLFDESDAFSGSGSGSGVVASELSNDFSGSGSGVVAGSSDCRLVVGND